MKWLLIGFIKLWRAVISPLYGNVCKYYPSCSAYGLEAVRTHGALKGSWLTANRIVRCNPWSHGGYDPVPGTPAAAQWAREQRAARTPPGSPPDSCESTANVGETGPTAVESGEAGPAEHGSAVNHDARGVN